jgi:hypothetical protein
MKKITSEAVSAFLDARPFKKSNMRIDVLPNVTIMRLYGNAIAYRFNDPERTLTITNCAWFTNTTKERLNALPNVRIHQRNWQWYLNGVQWDGNLIDIK